MPTECSAKPMGFARVDGRAVVADFEGGAITSNAGGLLLGATDRAIGLVERFAACFTDGRSAERVVHELATLVGQRVFGIALGYEDLVDHDRLRHDPVLGVALGRLEARHGRCAPLAGKSTLNRLEHGTAGADRYRRIAHDGAAIEALFVDLFLDAHDRAPKEIVLDLDATDDPLHGHQEGRFFHGYYDCHCYLPLYVFCGRHLLSAKLRRANIDASAGAVEEVARIVGQVRGRWPQVRIILRGDGGFAREALMAQVAKRTGSTISSGSRATRGWSSASRSSSPGPSMTPKPPAAPPAASPTSAGPRVRAGAAAGASSPRPNGCPAALPRAPIPASSSPRSTPPARMPARSTSSYTAPAARWRTGSRSASSISSPTAPAPPPCVRTSCGCGSPPWPMC
jgi:hypothetical protein